MVTKNNYVVSVLDFGGNLRENLLILVHDRTGNLLFIKSYLDPEEARRDYDKIFISDDVERWEHESFDYNEMWTNSEKLIARDKDLFAEHYTHKGRAMFAKPLGSDSGSLVAELLANKTISFEGMCTKFFDRDHYITSKEEKIIIEEYREIHELLLKNAPVAEDLENNQMLLNLLNFGCQNIHDRIEHHNNKNVERTLINQKEYLDAILKELDPNIILDEEQRKVIVVDDDYCRVIACAGSGKTTTMAAKVKYLVDKKGIEPKDILMTSFTNKTIDELRERINDKLGIKAKVSTFHSFGFKTILKDKGRIPAVINEPYNIMHNCVVKILYDNNELLKELFYDFSDLFKLNSSVFDYASLNEYHKKETARKCEGNIEGYIRGKEKMWRTHLKKALTGERLRSCQEVDIANFLYRNCIDYEYEKIYESDENRSRGNGEHPSKINDSEKEYTPDFYITQGEKRAYIEHYALSEYKTSDVLEGWEIERYLKNISDKREHHNYWNTTLIETWAKYQEGDHIDHLRDELIKKGFVLKERDQNEIYELVRENDKDEYTGKFTKLIERFIKLYKTKRVDSFDVLRSETSNGRTLKFLDVAEKIYSEYMDILTKDNKIDFEDMINHATDCLDKIQERTSVPPYKYIIVDEYQDINKQRFDLINKLSEITGAKIVAVGDDWQSIYAFAGSDESYFTNIQEKTDYAWKELKITKTYRNSQELIDVAGSFIQKNPHQIKKKLKSDGHTEKPIVIKQYDDERDWRQNQGKVVEEIIREIYGSNNDSSILLLGRYGFEKNNLKSTSLFDVYENGEIYSVNYKDAKLKFMTVHSAKGLERDNVIILNMWGGKYGFPSQVEDDPVLELVKSEEDKKVKFAEERRLFYVALTRTKNKVYLVAPTHEPSLFLEELAKDYESSIEFPENGIYPWTVDFSELCCPKCGRVLEKSLISPDKYICTNDQPVCCNYIISSTDIFQKYSKRLGE